MHKPRAMLFVGALLAQGAVHADSALQGLEMDVMDPGESAAHATARIALPRPQAAIERSAEYPGIDVEQRLRPGAPASGDAPGIIGIESSELVTPSGPVAGPDGTVADGMDVPAVAPAEEPSETPR